MHDMNWLLMAAAFLIGLVLTFAMTIRKVSREVPVTHTVAAGIKAAGAATAAGAAAATLSGASVAKAEVLEHDPYGAGSIRVTRTTAAPSGYTIKGDKDTGRYFTLESPDYRAVEAEVWFADEESAQKAGFLRWDARAGVSTVDAAADATRAVITGGTTIPDDVAAVITGGGAVVAGAARIVSVDEVPAGPHGRGSAKAGPDGSGPAGWLIKGNADSMLFHGPDSPAYEQTIAEVWFFDEETARTAGFDRWDRNFR
jgi:hypothetical protein